MIKAIETEYNGYRFRSRLEARWAVFFDAAGIEYQYEPEGFELSCGWYLPDFYLPDFEIYVEIKPFDKNVVHHVGDGNEWEVKCDTFRDETGKAILLCYDDPSKDVFKYLSAYDTTDSSGGNCTFEAVFKQYKGDVYLVVRNAREDRSIYISSCFDWNEHILTAWEFFQLDKLKVYEKIQEAALDETMEPFDPNASDILNASKKAARQARFEHGETPVIRHE